jgi:hypothetical protein
MPLNKGKHTIQEIDGARCSVVETGVSRQRMEFLKDILTLNHYEVKTAPEAKKEGDTSETFIVGVTDFLFNPVIDVYKRRLLSKTGHKITPAYWLQISDAETEAEVNYWNFKK